MEILKATNSETEKNNFEGTEMKENIIQRSKVLLDENGALSKKVLGNKWNVAEKREILGELSRCRVDTKKTAENYFVAADVSDEVPDDYKKAA